MDTYLENHKAREVFKVGKYIVIFKRDSVGGHIELFKGKKFITCNTGITHWGMEREFKKFKEYAIRNTKQSTPYLKR